MSVSYFKHENAEEFLSLIKKGNATSEELDDAYNKINWIEIDYEEALKLGITTEEPR